MGKNLLILSAVFFLSKYSDAQVLDSRTKIDTSFRAALYMESDMSESDIEDALDYYFDSLHIEKEKAKGFIIKKSMPYLIYKRAKVNYVDDVLDYFFQVDTKKQKGPNGATIYIAVSKGYNNFLSPEMDNDTWKNLKQFAEYLRTNLFEQYRLKSMLTDVSKEMEKRKKKLADLNQQKKELENNLLQDSTQLSNLSDLLQKLKTGKH